MSAAIVVGAGPNGLACAVALARAGMALGLERHGLEWRWPEIDLAHPLDDGSAGVMLRSVEATVEGLGDDGATWRRVFATSAQAFDALTEDLFRPVLHVPSHPIRLGRFGLPAALPATLLARAWKRPRARALFGGVAAHALSPLNRPMSSAVGVALICACHRFGWAVARGGSSSITSALAAVLVHGMNGYNAAQAALRYLRAS